MARTFGFQSSNAQEKVEGEELDLVLEMYVQVILKSKGSEGFITNLLRPDKHGKMPVEHRIQEISAPICFLFGDVDWVETTHAFRLSKFGHLKPGSMIRIIPNCGHMLQVENSKGVSDAVLDFMN